jgi:hypothetical protein
VAARYHRSDLKSGHDDGAFLSLIASIDALLALRNSGTQGPDPDRQRRANDDTRRPTIVRAFRQPLDATLGRSVVGVRMTRRIS